MQYPYFMCHVAVIFYILIFSSSVVLVRVGKTLRRRNCVAEKAIYIPETRPETEKKPVKWEEEKWEEG